MISRRSLSSILLAAPAVLSTGGLSPHHFAANADTASPASAPSAMDWRETYAYTLGMQAYIFGFPWIYLPSLRCDLTGIF